MLKHIYIGLFLFIVTSTCYAKEYVNCVADQGSEMIINDTRIASDPLFPGSILFDGNWKSNNNISDQKASAYVRLEFVEDYILLDQDIYVKIAVKGYYENGATFEEDRELLINFNGSSGSINNYMQQLQFDNVYQLQFTLLEVKQSGTNLIMLPEWVRLGACVQVDRLFQLPLTEVVSNFNNSYNNTTSMIVVNWDKVNYAESYDLEWTYVNNYDNNNGSIGNIDVNQLLFDFNKNSNRVNISDTVYEINNVFGRGFVLFRIRAIGQTSLNSGQMYASNWSCESTSLCRGTIGAFLSSGFGGPYTFEVNSNNAHHENLNWSFKANYAEQGKRKEIVEYADGLGKYRQMVSRIPSIKEAVVTETVYDNYGRPIVNTMPSPTGENRLGFYENFNLNENDAPIHFTDFENESDACLTNGIPFSKSSGASRYYSYQNPNKTDANAFIPEANGFVYNQIEYTTDKTGRISKQTGPGEIFSMGAGREQVFMYGQPLQIELDRLFGTEVGKANHYKKVISSDPNGQKTVKYNNLSGKTIATALVGIAPLNLEKLDSYPLESQLQPNILHNSRTETSLNSYFQLTVAETNQYTFHYNVSANIYKDFCTIDTICFKCPYELVIDIQDACGIRPNINGETTLPITYQIGQISYDCIEGDSIEIDFYSVLNMGEYVVSKTLQISEESINTNFNTFLELDTCVKKYYDFIQVEKAKINYSDCYENSCESDCDKLKNNGASIIDIMQCKLDCSEDLCQSVRDIMLIDVSPGGQYALTDDLPEDATGNKDYCYEGSFNEHNHAAYDTPSVLCDNNSYASYKDYNTYVNSDGTPSLVLADNGDEVAPESLSPSEFVANWQDSWAETLIQAHVEYNCLSECYTLSSSRKYKQLLILTSSYEDAYAMGLFNPLGLNNEDFPNYLIPVPENGITPVIGLELDPLFLLPNTNVAEMRNYLENYQLKKDDGTILSFSLWEMAAILANCPVSLNETANENCVNDKINNLQNYYPDQMDVCMSEDIWTYFKALYLAKREELYYSYQKNLCNVSYFETYHVFADKVQRFPNPEKEFGNYFPNINLFETSANSRRTLATNAEEIVDPANYNSCDSVCGFYIPYWMEKIKDCSVIQGDTQDPWDETNAKYANLLDKLTAVCVAGCDLDHLTGSSSIPIEHTGVPSGIVDVPNFRSFEDVFKAIIGPQYLACNSSLISMPMPYGYEYNENKAYVSVDTCACNAILTAKQAMNNGLCMPGYINSLEQYFEFNFDIPMPNADKLSCLCEEAFMLDTGELLGENAETHWTPQGNEVIENIVKNKYQVNGSYACQPCYSCDYIGSLYVNFWEKMDSEYNITQPVTTENLKVINTMLLNDLSAKLNILIDYDLFEFIKDGCDLLNTLTETQESMLFATESQTEESWPPGDVLPASCWEIPKMNSSVEEFLNGLIEENDLMHKACLCVPPYGWSDEIKDFGHHNLYMIYSLDNQFTKEDCEQTYLFDREENGVYYAHIADVKGNRCDLEFSFVDVLAGYALEQVQMISNVRPYYTGDGTTNHFMADVQIIHQGQLKTVALKGYNSCIDFYACSADTDDGDGNGNGDGSSNTDGLGGGPIGSRGSGDGFALQNGCIQFPSFKERFFGDTKLKCKQDKLTVAYFNATEKYQQYIDSLYPAFRANYLANCLPPKSEEFDMAFNNREYHYTLFYYDKAGNLIKTIAPNGVSPITDPTVLNDIQAIRKDNLVQEIHPNHRMPTVYEYNSLNQVVRMYMPDHKSFKEQGLENGVNIRDKYHSQRFWYDALGRLVASQTTKQAQLVPPRYSYTVFDQLGRIIENGELASDEQPNSALLNNITFPNNWTENTERFEVSKSYYDTPFNSEISNQFGDKGQVELRNRVATIGYYESYYPSLTKTNDFDFATHYSYDFHGNVKTIIQDIKNLTPFGRYKRVDYSYDLISGNVKQVLYQAGKKDVFYHRYAYDEDNRIVQTETSTDGIVWESDANYQYYKHGPISRLEIGERKVQGLDYAYTLQGWLKSLNGFSIGTANDMGNDGSLGSSTMSDVFSLGLRYYTNDYEPIGAGITNTDLFPEGRFDANAESSDLFNGNIKQQVVDFQKSDSLSIKKLTYAYRYDQLNRITDMKSFGAQLLRPGSLTSPDEFATSYSYDANGNISTLLRNGNSDNLAMDNLTYRYETDPATGLKINNRLLLVNDAIQTRVNKTDIEDMGLFAASNSATWNYQYDAMGNLISDKADSIINISWTVSGKVKSIIREVGCMKPDLYFAYDASNNRVMKLVKHKDLNGNIAQEKNWDYTWYVRDAAGNVMATYAQTMEILPNNIYTESLEVNEWIIYGSSRVGVKKAKPGLTLITGSSFRSKGVRSDGSYIRENYTFGNSSVGIGLAGNGGNTPKYKGILSTYTAGLKQYELTNHLGNVMSVVTDRKTVQLTDGNTSGFNYQPDVVSATDYYPFGSVMPGRSFSSNAYRYGFSGFERDDEIKGSGNSVNMGDRMLDTRLGRTFKTDRHAYKYPYISPYAYALNSPLIVIDPDGKDVVILIAKDGAGGMGHMGALIQDKGGNWFYMTQGAADTEGGVSKMMSGGVQGGVMLQALNTTDIEEAIQIAKQDVNNSPYTDQVILKTSAKMDEKIFEKAKEVEKQTNSGDKKYNLLFNNCVDACQEPIEEGLGLNMPKDVDPRPNNYFEKLDKKLDKFQNKLDRQMKKESSPTTQSNQDLDFGSEDKLILGSEGY